MFRIFFIAIVTFLITGGLWVIGQTCGVAPAPEEKGIIGKILPQQCGPETTPVKRQRIQPDGGTTGRDGGAMETCESMMLEAGLSKERISQMRVISQASMYLDSPAVLYGRADELQLSSEQKERLMSIMREARTKALEVLTGEQREKLGGVPALPITVRDLCEEMHTKMTSKGRTDRCPMCPTMQKKREASPSNGNAMPERRKKNE